MELNMPRLSKKAKEISLEGVLREKVESTAHDEDRLISISTEYAREKTPFQVWDAITLYNTPQNFGGSSLYPMNIQQEPACFKYKAERKFYDEDGYCLISVDVVLAIAPILKGAHSKDIEDFELISETRQDLCTLDLRTNFNLYIRKIRTGSLGVIQYNPFSWEIYPEVKGLFNDKGLESLTMNYACVLFGIEKESIIRKNIYTKGKLDCPIVCIA